VVPDPQEPDHDKAQGIGTHVRQRLLKRIGETGVADAFRQLQIEHKQRDGNRHDGIAEGEHALGLEGPPLCCRRPHSLPLVRPKLVSRFAPIVNGERANCALQMRVIAT
jgi:hypothetical protein